MFIGNDRQQMRQMFFDVWRKQKTGCLLQPLEQLIAQVIAEHPEYQTLLDDPDSNIDMDYSPELGRTNPFLHMGLHIAIREQIASDRPAGMAALWITLLESGRDAHGVEHEIQECLAEAMWVAQRDGQLPVESGYLDCIRRRTAAK